MTTSTAATIGRGVVAGVAGTVVMTAFPAVLGMPVTARGESFAPAELSQQVTPLEPGTPTGRRRLDLATHFALGTLWGAAYAVAAAKGLRGQAAVNRVFAVVCTGDVLRNTALGLYAPRKWSTQDWVVHLVDTYVQAQGTGLVFDRALDPAC